MKMSENTDYHADEPWVSFCMTTYKRPAFLHKQLTAIRKQTFPHFRVIVSDNDVDASAKDVVESFDDVRFSYFNNGANLGMVKSFNSSLAKATTQYVVMITDDDPPYPEMLETLYDLTIRYPGYGMYMGGCDIVCENPVVARSSRLKVGTNSCLADIPMGTIRTFTGRDFPYAYFRNSIGGHLLWSTGIVKRDIALKIHGMPDFGAPYNTDFGYIALAGSYEGTVLINTSFGAQVVHGANYGFTESDFERFYVTPVAFVNWIMDHLPSSADYTGLKSHVEVFTARWVVEYAVSVKKFLRTNKLPQQDFDRVVSKIFQIPFLRKWRYKYLLAVNSPQLFELGLWMRSRFVKPAPVSTDGKI